MINRKNLKHSSWLWTSAVYKLTKKVDLDWLISTNSIPSTFRGDYISFSERVTKVNGEVQLAKN